VAPSPRTVFEPAADLSAIASAKAGHGDSSRRSPTCHGVAQRAKTEGRSRKPGRAPLTPADESRRSRDESAGCRSIRNFTRRSPPGQAEEGRNPQSNRSAFSLFLHRSPSGRVIDLCN
jgi:hypothetical protein